MTRSQRECTAPGVALLTALALASLCLGPLSAAPASPTGWFALRVVDARTSRGVPLVELRTAFDVAYYTDSNGIAAIGDPELMGHKVYFHVRSHGYEYSKDGFGNAGVALEVKPGGRAEIKVKRMNLAERLYRVTGAGIYRDSILVGEPAPILRPLLNAEVAGQDSVQAVPFDGRLYWFWGDTNRLRYPLGLFSTSGATSVLPGKGLDPAKGIDLEYFAGPDGFSRAMAPLEKPGPVWLDGLAVVPDERASGRPCMVAHYSRMKSLGETLEHGLMVWEEKGQVFRKRVEFSLNERWRCPRGQSVRWTENGKQWLLFATPFATVRAPASLQALSDPAAYEAFTCLVTGTRYKKDSARLDRGPDGKIVCAWKPKTDPISAGEEKELIRAGRLQGDEAQFLPRDVDGGEAVQCHSGSVAWNEYRKKWVMIAVQIGGSSLLGEVWFSEADSPLGPWRSAKKIVTHDRYTFYNPVHHPFLDQEGGRLIYFQGTYASTFSGNPVPTPRYDYNQIMYRLDLSDPRLAQSPGNAEPGALGGPRK